MNLRDKKILVTGGKGFIGTHLVKRLQDLNANVEVFDHGNGDDICDFKKVREKIQKKFDIIYHLAGFSGSSESNINVERSFKVNTLATINIFENSLKYSPRTGIILSSSRLEYGRPRYVPVDENHPTEPISAYGLSKLCATQIAMIFHKTKKLDVTVFRTSNVYGQHRSFEFGGYNIINHFIDLAKQNKILKTYGDGNQIRDYLHIDDLVDAFILALSPKSSGKIYNLGYGKGIKFKEMVKLIIKIVGQGKLKFVNWPEGYKHVETGSYISDISKIKKELGFSPKVNFEEGIRNTLKSITINNRQ